MSLQDRTNMLLIGQWLAREKRNREESGRQERRKKDESLTHDHDHVQAGKVRRDRFAKAINQLSQDEKQNATVMARSRRLTVCGGARKLSFPAFGSFLCCLRLLCPVPIHWPRCAKRSAFRPTTSPCVSTWLKRC